MRGTISRRWIGGLVGILIGASPMLSMAQSVDADKAQTLLAARERYYNLRTLGLSEVRAAIQPNWDLLLEGTKSPKCGIGAVFLLLLAVADISRIPGIASKLRPGRFRQRHIGRN